MLVSPLFWVILVPFLVFNGASFYALLDLLSQPMAPEGAPMQMFFGGSILFWLAVFPMCALIPMGTIASERRNGTIETLMTAPVSDFEVVLAKFLAAWITYILLWAPVALYVLVLARYGDPEPGPIAAGFLGTVLIGAAFLSIGVLASALTRSQIIAAVIAFMGQCVLLVLGVMEYLSFEGWWHDLFHYLNIWSHFDDWGRGIVDTRYVVYYAALTCLCLFCAVRALETRRWR
jgi:ABC-2 type transport system permease protein